MNPTTDQHERELQLRSLQLLCLIVRKLSEIEAQLHSPLTARQLQWRYCARCGERVTNANVGGYEGRSALTGRLFCLACADDVEGKPS
jgi:formylmethanofuran dehydrogenase subunit E